MKKLSNSGSLLKKYLLPLMSTMLIALLLGGILISVLVYNQITKVESSIKEQARQEFIKDVSFKHKIFTNKITYDITNKLSQIDNELYKLSNSIHVRQMNSRYIRKEADSLILKDPSIVEFKIVNEEARADYAHCDPERLYSDDLGILRPKDIFPQDNKLFVSKTFYDIESGERYNYLARPILDFYGRINSYIMLRYNLDFITDSIQSQQVKSLGNFYVLDNNNILVGQSNGELLLNKYQHLSGEEQMLLYNQKSGSVWNDKLLSFYKNDMGWTFAMETPDQQAVKEVNEKVAHLKSDFNKAIYKILTLIALGLLSIALLTTIVGIKVAKSITNPVLELIKGVRKIAAGDLDVQLTSQSNDEIGELTYAFNDMSQSLKDYQERIKEDTNIISKQAEALGESNEELKNYAHTVSHDLKAPLRTISGYIGLIDRRYKTQLDDAGKEYLQYIKEGTSRMNRTIEDMLSYAKLDQNCQSVDFNEKVDLNLLIKTVKEDLTSLIEENNARIVETELPVICGCSTLLYSLFQNLINNGIKYKRDIDPYIKIYAKQEGDKHFIFVEDNGAGIEEQYLKEIFQPFKRLVSNSEVEGTGIGLATVKKIVGFHNGSIELSSQVGKGSIFKITFPESVNEEEENQIEEESKVMVSEQLVESIEYVNGNGSVV